MQNVKPACYDVVNYVYVFMGNIKAGNFLSCYSMLVIRQRICCGSVYTYNFEAKTGSVRVCLDRNSFVDDHWIGIILNSNGTQEHLYT